MEEIAAGRVFERIAEGFVATQGYAARTLDEAMPLATTCDVVLTKLDGMNVSVLCLVDAESVEARRFDFDKAAAKEILAACGSRYGGTLVGSRLPASLVIVEVRRSSSEEDLTRLRRYSNRFFDTDAIHAFVVDTSMRRVITATRYSAIAGWGWRRFLRRTLAVAAT